MIDRKRPLTAVAVAATLSLTVTAAATAQGTAVTPDTAGGAARPPRVKP